MEFQWARRTLHTTVLMITDDTGVKHENGKLVAPFEEMIRWLKLVICPTDAALVAGFKHPSSHTTFS
jgi:hypothetical protein